MIRSRTGSWVVICLALAVLSAAAVSLCSASPSSKQVAIEARDLHGKQIDPFHGEGRKATVLFFVTTDCPVANSYAPEIHRICAAYAPKDVRFYLVYVDPKTTDQAALRHLKAYDFGCQGLTDRSLKLVHLAHATVTPEAALFSPAGRLLYHGKIDDRAVNFGNVGSVATTHELRDALDASLSGRPIAHPATRPFGCFIADLNR